MPDELGAAALTGPDLDLAATVERVVRAGRMLLKNLLFYRRAPRLTPAFQFQTPPRVSVLIPARDEEGSIAEAIDSVLSNRGVELELLVLDDHSEDETAAIVESIAATDDRLRLLRAPPLPSGWNGKMHACHHLSRQARGDLLVFVDADVRLAPDALSRMAGFMDRSGADLASGIPRQETVSALERLIIPLIHFVMLAFLPLSRMRRSTHPAFASGIGQLIIARREAYERVGGHGTIWASRHDGIHLPKAFREAGLRTDLFDATDVATCRMYHTASEVWAGFAKNADEGLGSPRLIAPITATLLAGQVLPFALLPLWSELSPTAAALTVAAAGFALTPRLVSAVRFRQPLESALLHPLGVTMLLANQWWALVRRLAGHPAVWKGRSYQSGAS